MSYREGAAQDGRGFQGKDSRLDFASIRDAACDHWPQILSQLGVDETFLQNRHGPCPGCGGRDRFRFDDKDGRGGWICGGGGDTQAGDGFALLMHLHGWDFPKAAAEVAVVLGITATGTPRPQQPSRRELEREAIRHMVAGTQPKRFPPYTKELSRIGVVRILVAANEWPRRPLPALVLPPDHSPGAYRWPVAHRRVDLIDLTTNPGPGYFHYGALPWMADPWQWAEVRRGWLRAFAALLLSDNGAASVRIVSQAEPEGVLYEGVRHAA